MAQLTLDLAIPRFKANEEAVDSFTNAGPAVDVETPTGGPIPSLQKLIATWTEDLDTALAPFLEGTSAVFNNRAVYSLYSDRPGSSTDGTAIEILPSDTGTHTGYQFGDDSSHTLIPNAGIYVWSASLAAWRRVFASSVLSFATSPQALAALLWTVAMSPAGTKVYVDSRVDPNTTIEAMPPGSGYFSAEIDNGRYILSAYTDEGHLEARIADTSVVPRAAFDAAAEAGLLPIGTSMERTPTGSGWVDGLIDNDRRIIWGVRESNKKFYTVFDDECVFPSSLIDTALDELNLLPSPNMAVFGDSMAEDLVGTAHPRWTTLLGTALGISVTNHGRGSQKLEEIAARQGGTPMGVTVPGNALATSGGTTISSYTVDIGYFGGLSAVLTLTGYLAGVYGTMTANGDGTSTHGSGTYTFNRAAPGAAVACPPGTPFYPDIALDNRQQTQIFWGARNDVGSLRSRYTTLATVQASMTAYLTPKIKYKLVIGVCTNVFEYATAGGVGQTNYEDIIEYNRRQAKIEGSRFHDLREELVYEGCELAGITPTSNDLIDRARGAISRSLLDSTDFLHLNANGSVAVANSVARKVRALGYYP